MRLRYFLITTVVVLSVSLFSLWAHNYLAQKDESSNITAILRQTAVTLRQIDWANPNRNDLQRIEYILAEELGENELNRFFILRDAESNIIYKSRIVSLLSLDGIATSPIWIRVNKSDAEMLVYNLTDERFPNRILQVGLITQTGKNNSFTNFTLFILFFSIGALGIFSSWLLSGVLFSPISKVGRFLNASTNALDKRGLLPNVPKELFAYLGKKDELRMLTEDLDSLLNKINTNYKTSRLWAAQMAHELKTPLSQLLLHLETTSDMNDPAVQKSVAYVYGIKNTINTFLDWAELQNSGQTQQKPVDIDVAVAIRGLVSMMSQADRERIRIVIESNFSVSANANHFGQLVQNLISNALKYSQKEVSVEISGGSIKVVDTGTGIPHEVLEKIGDPFNFGNSKLQKKGHGLGLAWIKTICGLYGWKTHFYSSEKGTTITIEFTKTMDGVSTL